jgi:fused signal recognition particle receptor
MVFRRKRREAAESAAHDEDLPADDAPSSASTPTGEQSAPPVERVPVADRDDEPALVGQSSEVRDAVEADHSALGAEDDEDWSAEDSSEDGDALEEDADQSGEETGRRRRAMRGRLGRARRHFASSISAITRRGRIDETSLAELEDALILADVGLPTTRQLIETVRTKIKENRELSSQSLLELLRAEVASRFSGDEVTLAFAETKPTVWLVVGVNGVGKTTTIGKLAHRLRAEGKSVVLAAGDTFRAAAMDQLEEWAGRADATIIRGADGADPSSVVFDAVAHAAARGADLVIADSAGRLHNKVNLMEELAKVRRIAARPPGTLTEVLLVIDATTGQNGLNQARQFLETAGVTGIVLTKLDGTAKGGIVLAIRSELGLPIKLVGLGESVEDLVEFDPEEFAAALIG